MNENLKLPRAIFWDWDGTLMDTFVFLNAAHNYVRGVFGDPPMDAEDFKDYFGKPREKLYAAMYGERMDEAKTHFEYYVTQHHDDLKPIDGAGELLAYCHSLGITMTVITNKRRIFADKEVINMGWQGYFSTVVGSGEADQDKPDAAPFHLANKRLSADINIDDIWFVGDTDIDMECAQNAGCKSVLVGHEPNKQELIHRFQPVIAADTLTELQNIIKEIAANS